MHDLKLKSCSFILLHRKKKTDLQLCRMCTSCLIENLIICIHNIWNFLPYFGSDLNFILQPKLGIRSAIKTKMNPIVTFWSLFDSGKIRSFLQVLKFQQFWNVILLLRVDFSYFHAKILNIRASLQGPF